MARIHIVEEAKPITKLFEKLLGRGYSHYNIFNDWLDLIIYALQGKDKEYLEIVHRYRNDKAKGEREIDIFSEMFAELMMATKKTQHDILGKVYEAYYASKGLGQYFTPINICDMMAKMIGDEKTETFYEPCSGSGRFLISYIKISPKTKYYAKDIDPICTKMTALNMVFFNADCVIMNGDALLGTVRFGYITQGSPFGGSIRELTPEECKILEEKFKFKSPQKNLAAFPTQSLISNTEIEVPKSPDGEIKAPKEKNQFSLNNWIKR